MSIVALRCKLHNRDRKLPFQLLQVAFDGGGQRAARKLTALDDDVVKHPWEYLARPYEAGLYCQHCLNEGNRAALNIDTEDLPDLGLADPAIVFQSAASFDAAAAVAKLQDQYPSSVRYVRELPAVPGAHGTGSVLARLHPDLVASIKRNKVLGDKGELYKFQEDAITAALTGQHTVVTTPTASGKTMTYMLPILDTLLRDPGATALYFSPLVALTGDQMGAVSRFDESGNDWESKGERFSIHRFLRMLQIGDSSVVVARYDGEVTDGDRQDIRKRRPRYLLTTPDMLHMGLLSGAFDPRRWESFFRGLRYVVIDELHTYRGLLGAGLANLLRRLRRICAYYGVQPQFLCASATLVDPVDTVEKLIGTRPVVISGDTTGAPQYRRQFVLWSDTADEETRALSTQAKNAILALLHQKVRTIAFGRSISEINDIYRFIRAELRESNLNEIQVRPFMRELTKGDKRDIISGLKSGRIHAVISTTALSMGIDIGQLSSSVMIGFPGSIAQLWQQAGRAGRAGDGLIVLIADNNALDQFFVNHPEVLFDLSAEPVYSNPDNPYVVRGHLLLAAREMALDPAELDDFGTNAKEAGQRLFSEGLLMEDATTGKLHLTTAGETAAGNIAFRNLGFTIKVLTEDDHQPLVEVDVVRAQRALHKYAHYQHIDSYYEVTRHNVDFDAQRGEILVRELEHPEYVTTPRHEDSVSVDSVLHQQEIGAAELYYGQVTCRSEVLGYYKVPLYARNEAFVYQPLGIAAPPPITFATQAWWLRWPNRIVTQYTLPDLGAGLYSLAGALRLATAIEELCDPSDIGVVENLTHPTLGVPVIFVYDAVAGGIGIAEASAKKLDRILHRALKILDECPYCSKHPESRGCPYCVTARYGDENSINRHIAIEMLDELLIVNAVI